MPTTRILFIDAYDSFSNNIISLLQAELQVSVESIKINDARFVLNDQAFYAYLDGFAAIVAGPGPGHPANATDVGLIARLWSLPEEHLKPVLGICLGFQGLCLAYGATVERLSEPRHGLITPVTHRGNDIFESIGEVLATQYHSLHVSFGKESSITNDNLWSPLGLNNEIYPLAWDLSSEVNGPIFMAARHSQKPFWGVQYHPESICTNGEGSRLVQNWWREVCAWRGEGISPRLLETKTEPETERFDSGRTSEDVNAVIWQCVDMPNGASVVHLVDMLRESTPGYEPILLESGMRDDTPVNSETGRFSIIGLQDAVSTCMQYSTSTDRLRVSNGEFSLLDQPADMDDVFQRLDDFMSQRKAIGGPAEVPFWGGLVGYVTYEAGLEIIDVVPAHVNEKHPDVCFIFVEKSVVVDHVDEKVSVQSLKDDGWVPRTVERLREIKPSERASPRLSSAAEVVAEPSHDEYCAKVRDCQSHLRAGSSYELCLTDTTYVHIPETPWGLYQQLRYHNPAPFGAYMHLKPSSSAKPGLHIASSSPERFLSWSRDGECQFRPIKGTVKKQAGVTRAHAEEILRSPKEQAENLMIVDLIRHDLSRVKGISNVHVPQLMSIEEYQTVYQLVSVISGHASNPLSVLAASLPPGSMTGAPKKRSCQLLRSIEGALHARGIYGGVVGYLDVGGGGDFSVAIRTAFKWEDEPAWKVGAGGAVTVLSEAEAEWEEMVTKRESVLKALGVLWD